MVLNVVMVILNCCFTSYIAFLNVLYGFWAGCSTGSTSLDAKIASVVKSIREEFLYVIFLDLHKVCGAFYRDICLEILEGYGVGPWSRRILRA